MAKLSEIYQYYKEEALSQTISGKLVSNVNLEKGSSIYFLDKNRTDYSFVNVNDKTFRVEFNESIKLSEQKIVNQFNHLYWINSLDERKNIEISRIKCQGESFSEAEQCICYGEKYVKSLGTNYRRSTAKNKLEELFVFEDGKYSYLFLHSYDDSDSSFGKKQKQIRLYGIGCEAHVTIKTDGFWEIESVRYNTKTIRVGLPRTYSKFIDLNVHQYKKVEIEERTQARIAIDTLHKEDKSGSTLMSLWKKYFDIELEEKQKLANELEDVAFQYGGSKKGGITIIKVISELKWAHIYENRYKLEGQKLELGKESLRADYSFDEEEIDNETSKKCKFKVIEINNNNKSIKLSDENHLINSGGRFNLSTVGDEVAYKRRVKARNYIQYPQTSLLTALYFAIEGKVQDISPNHGAKKYAPVTPRTTKLLEDMGINKLTDDQKRAVEIALNTPDLALIQGPPGTGKSTVVAVICDRLEEIALESKETDPIKKIFLVSAFQHDTVENTAAKIKTNGLPTPKVGEQSESMPAEQKFIADMKKHIVDEIEKLGVNSPLKSLEIQDIIDDVEKGCDSKEICDKIVKFITENKFLLSEERENEWPKLCSQTSSGIETPEEIQQAFEKIPTEFPEFKAYHKTYLNDLNNLWDDEAKLSQDEEEFVGEVYGKLSSAVTENDFEKLLKMKKKYLNESTTPDEIDIVAIKRWLEEVKSDIVNNYEINPYGDDNTFYYAVLKDIERSLNGNDQHIKESLLNYSKSIAATNSGAGRYEVTQVGLVENVILEEAARSNPLDLLIPMTRAENKIIMVGDQMQLPHLLDHKLAGKAVANILDENKRNETLEKYGESLFGHIYNNLKGVEPKRIRRLSKQFRMHPVIGNFISELYYQTGEDEEKLSSGFGDSVQAEKKRHGLLIPEFKEKACVFIDVPRKLGPEKSQGSKYRSIECKKVFEILDEIKTDPKGKELSVGIITFYSRQRDELLKEGENREGRKYVKSGTVIKTDDKEMLRIGTVDSFQGKEFDVVILSTVRSNEIRPFNQESIKNEIGRSKKDDKEITEEDAKENLLRQKFGFLTEQRLNVAFSRAKKLLITVGDAEMFQGEDAELHVKGLYEFYKRFHQ